MDLDDVTVANHRTRLNLLQNNLAEAKRWVQERQLSTENINLFAGKESPSKLSFMDTFEYATYARILIEENEIQKALQLINLISETAASSGWIFFYIEAQKLKAMALQKQDETDPALWALNRSLAFAENGGFIKTYVDEHLYLSALFEQIPNLPSRANEVKPTKKYVHQVLTACQKKIRVAKQSPSPDDLSERELEVMRLIAAGFTNQEIAKKLFISLNTVRTHTKNINSKLTVHSRTQAIARAKALEII